MRQLWIIPALMLCSLSHAETQTEQPTEWALPTIWGESTEAPEQKPYQLPRFDESTQGDHYTQIRPLAEAPALDPDALFTSIQNCYPEPSKFRLELDLEASYRDRKTYDLTGSEIGQHYIGIVARMPLYSANEMSRQRLQEHKRRTETAAAIGALMTALANRNNAVRELGLFSSLEARSQVRVAQGVAETAEQVGYLTSVAAAHAAVIRAEAAIVEQRLALSGQCADGPDRTRMAAWLKRITELPR